MAKRLCHASRFLLAAALLTAGCAMLHPGFDAPKPESTALAHPETTTIGRRFEVRIKEHGGLSGFRLLADGTRSFALRMRIAEAAERTLDAQYFLLQTDDTGLLFLCALLDAADRGVHVRLLLDDALAMDGATNIRPLAAHPNIEVRIFNPHTVGQQFVLPRVVETLIDARRLNYRMHNKLFIADNAIAVTGGRNIANEYFQASRHLEFGDFDLAAAGPIVRRLSASFDTYWNDRLAVPIEALPPGRPSLDDLEACRAALARHKVKMASSGYLLQLPKRDELADMQEGRLPMVWANAVVAYDSPDKASTINGDQPGQLMWRRVATAAEAARADLIIVSPYLVPGPAELALLGRLRERGVRVRILTNSLASTDVPLVHAAYRRYRIDLLAMGVELYEVRPQPGQPRTRRGHIKSPSSGAYALHAKAFVFDQQRVFIGSMNFDQRSFRINTELGMIIDSPEIARDISGRFEAIAQPANSYRLVLSPASEGGSPTIRWLASNHGKAVSFETEPGVDLAKRVWIETMSLLPLGDLL